MATKRKMKNLIYGLIAFISIKKTSITHSLNRFIMGDLIINIMYIVIIFIGIWYIIKDFSTITTGILISFLTIIPKIYSSFRVLLNVNISSKIIKILWKSWMKFIA